MKAATALALAAIPVSLCAQQNPRSMSKIGTVDERFQSYNVEMVEVIGGRFWKPFAPSNSNSTMSKEPASAGGSTPFEQRPPVDLSNPRLRTLAAALGPAYMRVSGTWANTVYFQDSDAPPLKSPPSGFSGVLTRPEWRGVVDFGKAVDARIVTSFAVSDGTRDPSGVWTPQEARKLLNFTRSIGGSIAAAEFINEPTFVDISGAPKGYDGAAYGRDFAVFQSFFRKELPGSILLGPGAVGEGTDVPSMKILPAKDLLDSTSRGSLDAFSYHFYGAASERCRAMLGQKAMTSAEAALTEEWLSRTSFVEAFYADLRDRYDPGKPIWLTEAGQAACGGDRWASTFLDSFHYLDELGRLAKQHVQVVMHNTLAASDYGLIDDATLTPRPNYWAALLWHKTMDTTVLDPGTSPSTSVHMYAHCMKDHPGGVALLAVNLNTTAQQTILILAKSIQFTLTAPELMSHDVQLNHKTLRLSSSGDVPSMKGIQTRAGKVQLPPVSITFLTIANADNPACR